MAWVSSLYSPSPPTCSSTSLHFLVYAHICLVFLCLFSSAQTFAASSSTSAPSLPASTGSSSNSSNVPVCSSPHPLFARPLNIFSNSTFPISSSLQPFPAGSFLHHCPNLNSSVGSCCNQQSVQFAAVMVDTYLDRRNRLSDGLAQLTLADLYYVLTGAARSNATANTSAAANSTAGLDLSSAQTILLNSLMQVVQLWGNGAINCSDHWMSYLTSTFCLACDPESRYYTKTDDPYYEPFFHLQDSVCSSIYSHCSSSLLNFFEHLPPLLSLLETWPLVTPNGYNLSADWWSTYSFALTEVANTAKMEINIDLCDVGGEQSPHADCSRIFCYGGLDHDQKFFPHAFRGLQYGADSRTLHFILDAHAYISNMVCTLRMGFNASGEYDAQDYADRSDGCPDAANLLHLLFPRQFEMSPILSSSCVSAVYHQPTEGSILGCTVPKWCWWDDAPASSDTTLATGRQQSSLNQSTVAGYSYYDELCDTNGLTWPLLHNTTDLDVAWPAYQVGCQLNFSRHICQLPPLPLPPPPAIVEVVDELFHRLFIVVVAVGVSVLLCVLGCLWRRYCVERAERLEARVVDERSGSEMELEWEEALMAGKRKYAGVVGVDASGLLNLNSPRSGRLGSNGW